MIDQKNPDELEESIELFFFAYRAFTSRPDRMLEQLGLGRVHHRILHFVSRNPQLAVNTLLGILGVSKQALNAPLRQLIAMKLVAVELAEHDRRVKQLSLTEAGRQLERQLTGTQMKHLAATFAAAGPQAERGWRAVMRAIPEKS
ncbi:MAG: transcriptional regulator, MarR family [Proteobacteria bacterium]|nr:transcriptional regulator, MarR family [Pseudomonadota bacterium]